MSWWYRPDQAVVTQRSWKIKRRQACFKLRLLTVQSSFEKLASVEQEEIFLYRKLVGSAKYTSQKMTTE